MYTLGNFALWFLAALAGFAFGIFFAGSFGLHQPLYVFSLAGLFGFIFALIAYRLSKNVFHRLSGRMTYALAAFIVLVAIAASGFILIRVLL